MASNKLRKFPKMPKASASLATIQARKKKFQEVTAYNKGVIAGRNAKKKALDDLRKMKASVR